MKNSHYALAKFKIRADITWIPAKCEYNHRGLTSPKAFCHQNQRTHHPAGQVFNSLKEVHCNKVNPSKRKEVLHRPPSILRNYNQF